MDQIEALVGKWSPGQPLQESATLHGESVAGPQCRRAGDRTEGLDQIRRGRIGQNACPVMIPANAHGHVLSRPLDDRIGICPVAYEVTETQDAVVAPAGRGQHGLERLQVGVNIAQDEVGRGIRHGTSE